MRVGKPSPFDPPLYEPLPIPKPRDPRYDEPQLTKKQGYRPRKPKKTFTPEQLGAIKQSPAGVIPAGLPQIDKKTATSIADSKAGQMALLKGKGLNRR